MTREEAIKIIQNEYKCVNRECDIEKSCGKCPYMMPTKEPILKAYEMAIQALEKENIYDDKEHYVTISKALYDKLNIDYEKALEQEPCEDAVSRQAVLEYLKSNVEDFPDYHEAIEKVLVLPSVTVWQTQMVDKSNFDVNQYKLDIDTAYECGKASERQTGKCKECKYFEYDSVAKVDGIPLIVAHEICNKWGNGCKTSEDGYCYLYEPQERR